MKIILADKHVLFRNALACYIEQAEPRARIIHADDFENLLRILESGDVANDLVMTTICLPGMNRLSGIRHLLVNHTSLPVMILTDKMEMTEMQRAINMGASGYFPKTLSGKALLQAAYKVVQGEKPVLPEEGFHDGLPDSPDLSAINNGPVKLTPREKQVLGFLLRGASNKDIAAALGVQLVTVKLHVRGVCRKLGAKNRVQAVLLAQQDDLAGQDNTVF